MLDAIKCYQESATYLLKTSALYSVDCERSVEPWMRRRFTRIGLRFKLATSEPKVQDVHVLGNMSVLTTVREMWANRL